MYSWKEYVIGFIAILLASYRVEYANKTVGDILDPAQGL